MRGPLLARMPRSLLDCLTDGEERDISSHLADDALRVLARNVHAPEKES